MGMRATTFVEKSMLWRATSLRAAEATELLTAGFIGIGPSTPNLN